MAVAAQSKTYVGPNVSEQKAHRSQITELPHVHQFVRHENLLVFARLAHDDGLAQGDRISLRRHGAPDHNAIAAASLNSHELTLEQPHRKLLAVVRGTGVVWTHHLK